ncbi:rCG42967 [Rattus norvegicus]|uniref:RCG42967 n=1 Tax=Rattus norvegicus TaxID=10116 RepID=A6IWI8_RAT|nr:rCG42967 [Rattus norvegicus]
MVVRSLIKRVKCFCLCTILKVAVPRACLKQCAVSAGRILWTVP